MSKVKYISALIGIALVSPLLLRGNTSGEWDLPGLGAKVEQHEEKLQNHEARINNVEKDTETIFINTNIPEPEHEPVPPASEPTPEPVTITNVHKTYDGDTDTVRCDYRYSDGSADSETFVYEPSKNNYCKKVGSTK